MLISAIHIITHFTNELVRCYEKRLKMDKSHQISFFFFLEIMFSTYVYELRKNWSNESYTERLYNAIGQFLNIQNFIGASTPSRQIFVRFLYVCLKSLFNTNNHRTASPQRISIRCEMNLHVYYLCIVNMCGLLFTQWDYRI